MVFPCHFCPKVFYSQRDVDDHENIHRGRRVDCQECDNTYSNSSNLRRHYNRIHKPINAFRAEAQRLNDEREALLARERQDARDREAQLQQKNNELKSMIAKMYQQPPQN